MVCVGFLLILKETKIFSWPLEVFWAPGTVSVGSGQERSVTFSIK